MYKEYKGLNLPAIDAEMLRFWEENGIFEKSVNQRDKENSWVFYEGPPSANGKPGIHHVMARTIKDLFCRYRSMKGSRVERKGGWDTHGLPVELGVEKELGITKEDIGKTISIAEYNKKCRESVMRYKDMWDDITRKMGYWVDLDNPYVTYENEYIESVWHLLKRLYDKDLIYKGFTIQPYSPAAGTGLSSHELNQPGAYQDITDTSAVAQFKLKGKDNEYILAWTTTPWTLPSNAALAVGKKIVYVKVKTLNRYTHQHATVILAKERLGAYFTEAKPDLTAADIKTGNKPMPYIEIVEELTGADLAGLEYEQLMPYVQPDKPAFRVITADFVSTSDGTGIVHIAPTFGADDFMVAKQNDIPPIMIKDENDKDVPLVDKQGRLVAEVTDFAGRYVKDYGQKEDRSVDVDIVIKLKEENLLFLSEKYTHSYPHCWRTDKPVLYYPLDSWFIKASSAKERMTELNKDIQWKPKSTGEGRFGKWLENLQDWNLSRSRYWGIPLPIWRTEDGLSQKCIGSIAELEKEIQLANEKLGLSQTIPEDLHRPYIDDVILIAENGEEMKRELDLIDVWFDSGSMPYAQWHYPFENKEKFEQNFPADFIAEGVDQTRGWFYTLHAIATMVFDKPAFKNVVSNGLVQDKFGKKMSKRLDNAVEPFETIAKYGADATRWYMISNAQVWDNLKFDINGLAEVQRKFFGTLYNTYSFFSLYANVDNFTYKETDIPLEKRPEIDRWIISLLNTLVKEVDTEYNDYEATNAARKIMTFVDDHLSNWYVRLCRRRFWKGDYSEDKIAAYQTLYECLNTIMKLMAPLAPFFSDWMYQNLDKATGKEGIASVHLTDFPTANEAVIDKALEERMDYAQRIASLILSLRKKDKLRVRQPLKRALLPVLNESFQQQVEQVKDLILAEVNVKNLEYITDTSGVISKKIKPNFKTLGRKLGKDMKVAMGIITSLGQEDIADIEKTGLYSLSINGATHELTLDDFEILTQDIPGWQVASDGALTVALDVTVTPELAAEGMARDLVNRIQNIRKEKGFEVTDRINVTIQEHDDLTAALDGFSDYIKEETLIDGLSVVENVTDGQEIELPGEVRVFVGVERGKSKIATIKMKTFVAPDGKFALKIPLEWQYKNDLIKSKAISHSFELYDNPVGYFQIFCTLKTKGELPKLIITNNLKTQREGSNRLEFTKRVSPNSTIYTWMAVVNNDFFLIKYIPDPETGNFNLIEKELEKVELVLPTIIYIKKEDRKAFLANDRFDKFMGSILALVDLRNRAVENSSYIELVVLIANHIDALLRLSLVLNNQIKNNTESIETSFIFQGNTDKPIFEKKIYDTTLNESIITQELHDELFNLYNERNKVVHRYVITDIKTRDILKVAYDYAKLQEKIGQIIDDLEEKQSQLKIGIYGREPLPNKIFDKIGIQKVVTFIKDKHGNEQINEGISIK